MISTPSSAALSASSSEISDFSASAHRRPRGQRGEVQLHDQASVGDGSVLFAQRVRHRVQIRLNAGVELQQVFVAHARARHVRGHECVGEVQAAHRILERVDLALNDGLARIAYGSHHAAALVVPRAVGDVRNVHLGVHPQVAVDAVDARIEVGELRSLRRDERVPGVLVRHAFLAARARPGAR